jgi:benzoate membrane transport protein
VPSPPSASRSLVRDFSASAVSAGFLAVLVSYCGPLLIFYQAAQSAQVSSEVFSSWVWGISMGAGVAGIALSAWLKVPVVTAWSAPGTALLVTLFPDFPLAQAIGAYLVAAAILLVIGVTGVFDRLVQSIPRGIAAGMMAGILFQFGVRAFQSVPAAPALALMMLGVYLVARRLLPRHAIVVLLAAGLAAAIAFGGARLDGVHWRLASLSWTTPEWTWSATLSFALPLVLVSLSGQFLPGMAILRASGYTTPARPLIVTTSLASVAVACFGGINIVIAAITAAMCTGRDAHEDPARRYVAGIANGVFYLVGGTFAGSLVLLVTLLPPVLVAMLAGLALLGAIGSSLANAMKEADHQEAALLTFLVTASGLTLWGLGSAFWGLVVGALAYLVLHRSWRRG